jgi:hypothetical protein
VRGHVALDVLDQVGVERYMAGFIADCRRPTGVVRP